MELEENIRICGIYGSESRSWNWQDLSNFCVGKCVLFGDFNIDIHHDGKKAEEFLEWADSCSLSLFTPETTTSLRSDRIIDFALSSDITVQMQVHSGGTSSDHKPILSTVPVKSKAVKQWRNFHFKVFSSFLTIVFSFWKARWNLASLDATYNEYV
jgi:hypothetical protein